MKTKIRKEAIASAVLGLCGITAVALAGGQTNCQACYTLNNITTCMWSVADCNSAQRCVGTGGVNPDGSVWVKAECQ